MTYIETQVSLMDTLWQFFVEAVEFSMLDLNPITNDTETERATVYDPFMVLYITIDSEIQISERVVKDAVTLFGDIGGF